MVVSHVCNIYSGTSTTSRYGLRSLSRAPWTLARSPIMQAHQRAGPGAQFARVLDLSCAEGRDKLLSVHCTHTTRRYSGVQHRIRQGLSTGRLRLRLLGLSLLGRRLRRQGLGEHLRGKARRDEGSPLTDHRRSLRMWTGGAGRQLLRGSQEHGMMICRGHPMLERPGPAPAPT